MEETEKRQERERRALGKKGNRRAFLTGVAGAAFGATAATLLPQAAGRTEATPGDYLILGTPNNTGNAQTELYGGADRGAVLYAENVGGGEALHARSSSGSAAVAAHGSSGLGLLGTTKGGPEKGAAGVHGSAEALTQDPHAPPQGSGDGVRGHSGSGPGVHGLSQSGPGVTGWSKSGPGVSGHSNPGPGVRGSSESGPGVEGQSQNSPGVAGHSESAFGVEGRSNTQIGVMGWTDQGIAGVVGIAPGERPGVFAKSSGTGPPMPSDGGVALAVEGRVHFSTAGSATVPARSNVATVPDPLVTASSHITVMFTANPGPASVAWVERLDGIGFTVHLSARARTEVPFTYLIVEPRA